MEKSSKSGDFSLFYLHICKIFCTFAAAKVFYNNKQPFNHFKQLKQI